jgi:hypothetical protein
VYHAADDGHGRPCEQCEVAQREQQGGWIRDLSQAVGKLRIGGEEAPRAHHLCGAERALPLPGAAFGDGRGSGAGDSGDGAQKLKRRRKGAAGSLTSIDQSSNPRPPDAGRQRERHEGRPFVV